MTNILQFLFNTYREKKVSDQNADGRKAFLRITKKEYERMWTGLKWHRLGSFCRFCRNKVMNLGFLLRVENYLLTESRNYTSSNPPRMQNQSLLVQFLAPDDGRCFARNILSFI
jgi:hypothetical protein